MLLGHICESLDKQEKESQICAYSCDACSKVYACVFVTLKLEMPARPLKYFHEQLSRSFCL